MTIALVADLHGNRPAAMALEKDLKRRGVTRIFCLGDIVGKGPRSDYTFDWAVANCELILGGNWDIGIGFQQFAPDGHYWAQLGEKRLAALRALPLEKTISLGGRLIRLFHGRPIMEQLLFVDAPAERIEPYLTDAAGRRCDVVAYADAHRQGLRTMSPGLFLNCGSVGNALGNPMCCYALLDAEGDATLLPDAPMPDTRLAAEGITAMRERYGSDRIVKSDAPACVDATVSGATAQGATVRADATANTSTVCPDKSMQFASAAPSVSTAVPATSAFERMRQAVAAEQSAKAQSGAAESKPAATPEALPAAALSPLERIDTFPCALDVRFVTLPYDREAAVADAQAATDVRHIDSFINEIRTGRYSRKPNCP